MNQSSARSASSRVSSVILLGVVALAAVGYLWRENHSAAPAARQVTIAQAGDFFLYAPLYVALDAGLFRKRALEVSLVSTGGDEKTWAAVIGGSAQFGVADPTFVAIADSQGKPGRVIANLVNGVPFWGISFDRSIAPIADPKALEKYSVATFPSPSTAYTLQKRMFAEAGLPANIREGGFGTLIAMLKGGKADIALELEPNVSQAVSDGASVLYAMPDLYGDFAITGLTTSPTLLADQPDVARDVVCALQEALDYIRNDPQQALGLLTQRFPEIAPKIARAAFERVVTANIVPKTIVTNDAAWQKAIGLRHETGDLANPKPMAAYVDNSLAQMAVESCRLAQPEHKT